MRPTTPSDMKLSALAGAVALALAAVPAHATANDWPTVLALDTCRRMAQGYSHKEAFPWALDQNWNYVKSWVLSTTSEDAARQVIRQEMAICPDALLR